MTDPGDLVLDLSCRSGMRSVAALMSGRYGVFNDLSPAAVLAEVAGLASALGKPLTVRLLPPPGLRADEISRFDDPYFLNTRVMPIA